MPLARSVSWFGIRSLTADVTPVHWGMSTVERVQTGIRIEKRTLKVLRALADYLDMSLGDLVEGIVLHALEGKDPFSPETLAQVAKLRGIYGLTLTAKDSHRLSEPASAAAPARATAADRSRTSRGRSA
jgi:hypothetical protein